MYTNVINVGSAYTITNLVPYTSMLTSHGIIIIGDMHCKTM